MKKLAAILLLTSTLSTAAFATTECTKEDSAKWMDQTKFQNDLKAEGYAIKVFKVTKGNCYEIYGKNKEGKSVEIYFNPITGEKVKTKIK